MFNKNNTRTLSKKHFQKIKTKISVRRINDTFKTLIKLIYIILNSYLKNDASEILNPINRAFQVQ